MNVYEIAIYAILVIGALVEITVSTLNVRNAKSELPSEFHDYYDAQKYQKSQEYLRANTRVSIIETVVTTVATVTFIALGGFNTIDTVARSMTQNSIVAGLYFVGLLALLMRVLTLPFSLYNTFVIEERFGFNRTTLKTFLVDQLKAIVLTTILGGAVFAGIVWFFESVGENAWVWCWIGVTVFQIAVMFLAPAFIMPLFNKFTPLAEGELRTAIETYAKQQNFKLQGIYTMDGSKRSTKANAYFTGFGRYRRVVLFDTLIQKHTTEELVAVLAHEIGHFKKKHILKQVVLSIGVTGFMFYLLSFFLGNSELFAAFKMDEMSTYAGIIFFAFLYSPISSVISLVSLALSRKFEFEADEYSFRTFPAAGVMETALKKLTVENLGNLTPHPLAVFLRYTHPPVLSRLARLRSLSGGV